MLNRFSDGWMPMDTAKNRARKPCWSVLLLMPLVAGSLWADQKGGAKPPKAPPPPPPARNAESNPRPNNARPNGALKGEGGKLGPRPGPAGRLPNPMANPVLRMMAMTPDQRERILEKLPPQRQEQLRRSFDEFDKLPPQEKARRLQLLQTFSNLPPEKQQILARQLPAFNSLPEDRRKPMSQELMRLWRMPENERQARLSGEELKNQFSPSELQMLSDISQNYPAPNRQ